MYCKTKVGDGLNNAVDEWPVEVGGQTNLDQVRAALVKQVV